MGNQQDRIKRQLSFLFIYLIFYLILRITLQFLLIEDQKEMQEDSLYEELTSCKEISQQPRLSNIFQLSTDNFSLDKVQAFLYDKFILLKFKKNDKDTHWKIPFDFSLIFQLLRQESQHKKLGRPYGLRFERSHSSLALKNQSDEQGLIHWRDALAPKINQRGFHQLFKPIKKIGKGNFASVYLVEKHEDGKKFAVKAFSKQGTYSQENGKQSLINEIQLMRKFNHKNLMKLYEVYESQNSIYISVELLEGGQLYDKIKAKHKFTPKQIKLVLKGILEGLQAMHEQNIMHRDLKPQNILLRKEGDFDCVIADFGLAQNASEDYMFVRCGTPGYVAPQVVNLKDLKAKYSPICDIFSVGVIFHIITLRKSPFPGRQYDQVLSQNRACKFNFEAQQYQSLPETWLNLLKRLLQKDPTKRISATEALNHQFFAKDQLFKQFVEQRKTHFMEQCNSPLMMSKNRDRKNKGLVRDDSCLKFKMKESVMTGRTDQNADTIQQIDSPAAIKQKSHKPVESRFKKAMQ